MAMARDCRAASAAATAAPALRFALFCASLTLLGRPAEGVKWLSLAHVDSLPPTTGSLKKWCNNVGRAENADQRDVCVQHPYIMASVARGASLGLAECQHQFRTARWNCSTEPHHRAAFASVLSRGTRETGFVHAITAAAVAHAITKTCSQGLLKQCGCDNTLGDRPDVGFSWGGCTDNAAYGVLFSRAYTDAREGATARAQLNLHNNEAGRKAIEAGMRTECKCHGVSGSCEYKTCWKALSQFRQIGTFLKDKFDGAKEVLAVPRSGAASGGGFGGGGTAAAAAASTAKAVPVPTNRLAYRLVAANQLYKPHTVDDIVYSEESPDFCEADRRNGSLGTLGRSCDRASKGLDGCDLMCCGRGYSNKKRRVEERCDCKFHWCCEVRCKTCSRDVEEHHCL